VHNWIKMQVQVLPCPPILKMNPAFTRCANKKCQSVERHEVIRIFDEDSNINHIASLHLKCNKCGCHFNRWLASPKRLKEVYGEQYPFYKNN